MPALAHAFEAFAPRGMAAAACAETGEWFTISRDPRWPVRWVQTHCTKTLTRRLDYPRNWRCTAAHASQATKPARWMRSLRSDGRRG
jgi:hypothetical protein